MKAREGGAAPFPRCGGERGRPGTRRAGEGGRSSGGLDSCRSSRAAAAALDAELSRACRACRAAVWEETTRASASLSALAALAAAWAAVSWEHDLSAAARIDEGGASTSFTGDAKGLLQAQPPAPPAPPPAPPPASRVLTGCPGLTLTAPWAKRGTPELATTSARDTASGRPTSGCCLPSWGLPSWSLPSWGLPSWGLPSRGLLP